LLNVLCVTSFRTESNFDYFFVQQQVGDVDYKKSLGCSQRCGANTFLNKITASHYGVLYLIIVEYLALVSFATG